MTKNESESRSHNVLKWISATVVGIGSGTTKFVTDVRREFFDNLRNSDHVKTVEEAYGKELKKLRDDRRAGRIELEPFIEQYSDAKSKFIQNVNAEAKKLGIASGEFNFKNGVEGMKEGWEGLTKGSAQRFRMLSSHTKTPVMFGAIATTAIGFAGTMMFFNSIAARNNMKKVVQHQNALDHER